MASMGMGRMVVVGELYMKTGEERRRAAIPGLGRPYLPFPYFMKEWDI